MVQNVTINIQNNYYVQAPSPKINMKAFGWGVAVGSAGGIGLCVLHKKSSKFRNLVSPITRYVNKLFGDDDLRNELNNTMISAKRNDCANTNPSADVSHSENITVNTNHSENDCSNTTETTTPNNAFTVTEDVKCNQQKTDSNTDSLKNKKAECSEVVESSSESVSYSTVQENKADLGEQYAADMKCSPAEEQKKSASFQQKNKRKV